MEYIFKLCPKASFIMNACIEYKCNNELGKKNRFLIPTFTLTRYCTFEKNLEIIKIIRNSKKRKRSGYQIFIFNN